MLRFSKMFEESLSVGFCLFAIPTSVLIFFVVMSNASLLKFYYSALCPQIQIKVLSSDARKLWFCIRSLTIEFFPFIFSLLGKHLLCILIKLLKDVGLTSRWSKRWCNQPLASKTGILIVNAPICFSVSQLWN